MHIAFANAQTPHQWGSLVSEALKNSRFILAILLCLIPLGHSAEQASVLVQFPNPSKSICATIFSTLSFRSTFPWGSIASWATLADTKSIAEEFLQAATQAPQAMHVAESKASSAMVLGIGITFASGTPPVFTFTYPPA